MSAIIGTVQNFQSEVLEYDGKVLVDFWAPWCGPCQMLSPIIDEIGQEVGEAVKVVKVNVDEETALASQYNVNAIPTVLLFDKGSLAQTFVGFRQKQEYLDAVTQ